MTDVNRLCEALQLDRDAVQSTLERGRSMETSALSMPWFARMVVGIGAWLTALSAIGTGSVFLFMLIGTETTGTLALLGAAVLGLALWILRRKGTGAYADQLGTATAAAGVGMIAAGVGLQTHEASLAALATIAVTALIVVATPKRTLQFLSALLAAVLVAVTLIDEEIPYYLDVAALAGPAGVWLTVRPPRRDLQPTAIVLLLLFPVLGIFGAMDVSMLMETPRAGGWFAIALHIGLFLWLANLHRARADEAARERLRYLVPLAALVCLLLPAGGSAALVTMMLAFVIGSRPLALLGTLLQIHYLWRFYYDLDITLLAKSGVLTAAGIALLAAWWLLQRRTAAVATP